jgi:hypothetical protein
MSAVSLNWRSLPYDPAKFLVKGTEIAQAIVPGTLSRFAIVETRALDASRMPALVYRLRDAATVSDAQVKVGERPHIVGVYAEPDQAVAAALEAIA